MKIIALFALLALAMSTAGCLDYTQEIVVNPDGSGSSSVDFGMSSSLISMGSQEGADGAAETREKFTRLRDRLTAHPAVSAAQYREYTEGDLQHFVVSVQLPDITRLAELQDELSAEQASDRTSGNRSEMRVSRQADGTLAFHYLLAVTPPATPEGQDAQMTMATREMMRSAFAGKNFTIRLRGPKVTAISAGNTTASDAGQAVWQIPFSELFSGEQFSRELTATITMQSLNPPRLTAPAAMSSAPVIAVYTGSIVPTLPALFINNYQSRLLPAWSPVPANYWQYPSAYR